MLCPSSADDGDVVTGLQGIRWFVGGLELVGLGAREVFWFCELNPRYGFFAGAAALPARSTDRLGFVALLAL